MPQLVQALKYELHHESVLSAFLVERAIKNTSVIGHALFWSVKASLHSQPSFERLYLILERFLMCCGSFKFRLYN
jgi:phosphatidylinositol-4,5-bisphosphate 3-kinase/phosphatidylinositol-4-phosphate 3-kinase